MKRRFLVLIAFMLTVSGSLGTVTSALAQEATPGTGLATPGAGLEQEQTMPGAEPEFPLPADPALCTVEPRASEELLAIWFPEAGTPEAPVAETGEQAGQQTEVTIPVGAPADDETVAGVITTVHEVFSCFEAGDFRRALSLFTDQLVSQFGPDPGQTPEEVAAFLEATPEPEGGEGGSEIVAITDVMLLEDGRVGAFVVDRSPEGGLTTVYAIFVQGDERWLVDEVIEFSPGE